MVVVKCSSATMGPRIVSSTDMFSAFVRRALRPISEVGAERESLVPKRILPMEMKIARTPIVSSSPSATNMMR